MIWNLGWSLAGTWILELVVSLIPVFLLTCAGLWAGLVVAEAVSRVRHSDVRELQYQICWACSRLPGLSCCIPFRDAGQMLRLVVGQACEVVASSSFARVEV